MLRHWLLSLAALFCLGGALVLADEDVFVKGKDKPIRGKISFESAKDIKVGLKDVIQADDIVDIIYEPQPLTVKLVYIAGEKAEKASLDPANEAKRKGLLAEALKKYEDALPQAAAKEPSEKFARRHIEYKIAMLKVRQVQEDGEAPAAAVAKLKDYAKKHSDSWQISRVLHTLGRMQLDTADYAGAEDTYARLAENKNLSDDVRQDGKLLAIQVKIQAGKTDEARADLKDLQGELPKGSRFFARARVAEAECLVAESKKFKGEDPKRAELFDKAVKLVREVIKDSTDKYVKAVGHNTLGYCYLEQGQPKDAMWEFLWVDVVYNQDRVQHAKALYYLWDLFTKDGDAPRAQDCREALMAPQFAGLEYQRLVQQKGDGKAP
jgi:tetratricopeptide (TPR) repeat protein